MTLLEETGSCTRSEGTSSSFCIQQWIGSSSAAELQNHKDIYFNLPARGRPIKIPPHHESKIAEDVRYFAVNNNKTIA